MIKTIDTAPSKKTGIWKIPKDQLSREIAEMEARPLKCSWGHQSPEWESEIDGLSLIIRRYCVDCGGYMPWLTERSKR